MKWSQLHTSDRLLIVSAVLMGSGFGIQNLAVFCFGYGVFLTAIFGVNK